MHSLPALRPLPPRRWRRNISGFVEHFVPLAGNSTRAAARLIKGLRLDLLVDLNGHTKHSGLPVMAYRPAPVQVRGERAGWTAVERVRGSAASLFLFCLPPAGIVAIRAPVTH